MYAHYILFLFCSIIITSCPKHKYLLKDIRDCQISAHRGGPQVGFPENALETMQLISDQIPKVMVEIDVRATKDNILILLHDKSLDRTTTGSGNIKEKDFKEIADLNLIDHLGDTTSFTIPKFSKIMQWLKNEQDVYLSLDVKERALFEPIIKMVKENQLLDRVEVICYTLDAVDHVYAIDPNVNISATVRNRFEYDQLMASDIPTSQISAFTGLSLSRKSFYDSLSRAGMIVTLGSLGNLDKQAERRGDHLYFDWKNLGIDRFATDRPLMVFEALTDE